MTGKGSTEGGLPSTPSPTSGANTYRCPYCRQEHPINTSTCPEKHMAVDQAFRMEGRILEGKYEVVRTIGRGGMGVVYEAVHKKIGRRVAIKMLLTAVKSTSNMLDRFRNEARMAASVGHRNIVDILDMGETPGGVHYIVMEYLDGRDLGSILASAPRLQVRLAVSFAVQILSGLRSVHARGIIHRDLKPGNVILVQEPGLGLMVKLLDFGFSRLGSEGGKNVVLTQTGIIFGTPGYMAPEQARGEKSMDHRVDIYACGILLYKMLTGSLPFEASGYNEMIIAITTEDPRPVTDHGVELPDGLAEVVMKAIRRDPDARYRDASEFFEAVRPFRSWDPVARKVTSKPPAEPRREWSAKESQAQSRPSSSSGGSTYSVVGKRDGGGRLVDVVGPSRIFEVVKSDEVIEAQEARKARLETSGAGRERDPDEAATESRVYSIVGKSSGSRHLVDVLGSGKAKPPVSDAEKALRRAMKSATGKEKPAREQRQHARAREVLDQPFAKPEVRVPPPPAEVAVPSTPPPRRRPFLFVAVAAGIVVVLGAVAGAFYFKSRGLEDALTQVAAQSSHTIVRVEEKQKEPPPPRTWKLDLEGLPDGARVMVDGTLHPERPVVVNEAAHARKLRVEAEGYEVWEEEVAVYTDVTLGVSMTPETEDLVVEAAKVVRKAGKPAKKPAAQPAPEEKPKKIDMSYPGLQ